VSVEWLEIAKPILTQGVLGLACVIQAIVIKRLYSDLQLSRQETIEALEAHAASLERVNDSHGR
jgi:hypothetical protein